MSENPRQFSSIDSSDANLHGSLTNRPASGVPAGDPIDFESLNRQVINQRTQQDYVYKESTAEHVLRREREIASSLRFKQQAADAKAAQALQDQQNQIQRNELQNRIGNNTPSDPEVASARPESPLAQQQRSTPERQPAPSTGSPPPTPNGTAARANPLVEPTATPAPGILKEAIATTAGNAINALPRALPQAAGRLVIPGVGAALSIGTRLVFGQSATQAVTSTGAGLIGTGIGAIVGTAIGGPIGGVVGGIIGGTAASLFSDWLFARNLPSSAAHLEAYTPNYPPFLGGQTVGGTYQVTGTIVIVRGSNVLFERDIGTTVTGPITSITMANVDVGAGMLVVAQDLQGNPKQYFAVVGHPSDAYPANLKNVTVTYLGGGVLESQSDIQQHAPPPDNSPYRYDASPVGSDNAVPSGTPSAGKNKGKTREIAPSMPSNNTPNPAPFFPGHGGLAPSQLPNPTQTPSNLGGMLPQQAPQQMPQKAPLPFAEPQDIPMPRIGLTVTPSEGGVVPITYAEVTPATITQSTITPSEGTDANGNYIPSGSPVPTVSTSPPTSTPETSKQTPVADGLSPTPKANSYPAIKTPDQAATEKQNEAIQQQKKDFDDQIARLTAIATGIAFLTPMVQGIPDAIANSPNVKASNKETTKGAVCEIAQPGGCLGDALDNSANKVNQNNNQNTNTLLDKINAGANAAQLALLELMNTKLGDLIPGGLSGKLQRLSSWLHLDRALNILIWWQTLHNAYMLSANLGQTLTSAISNVLAAIGIKDAEGSPLEIGAILGQQFDSLAKSVIGESEWGGIKAEYKKWNRIYQAAANLMNSIQSIGYSILSALEVVGSWVAVIGNALRKWGEVGESAYKWMNPTPNFQNKFFTALEKTEDVVSQIDSVASEVLSIQETVTQIGSQKTEFLKALGEEPNSKQGATPPEASKIKASSEASKTVSVTGIAISDSDKEADD